MPRHCEIQTCLKVIFNKKHLNKNLTQMGEIELEAYLVNFKTKQSYYNIVR